MPFCLEVKPTRIFVLRGAPRLSDTFRVVALLAALRVREVLPTPEPDALMRPLANVLIVRKAVLPTSLWPTTCTPQPVIAILVFCLTWPPFWPVITVGMTSVGTHRLPLAASA